jgi:hypothetical protein
MVSYTSLVPELRRAKDRLRSTFEGGPEWERNRRQLPQRSGANRECVIWTVSCLIAVLGLAKAGCDGHHVFWLMVWPVPVTIASTIFIFVRQGFHFKDGLLVLGRRASQR